MGREPVKTELDPDDHGDFKTYRDDRGLSTAEAGRRLIRGGLERERQESVRESEAATDGGHVAGTTPQTPASSSWLYHTGLAVIAAGFLLLGVNLFISPGPQVYATIVILGGGACVLIAEILPRFSSDTGEVSDA